MKVAVLSDIHGNIVAFMQAIKDANTQGVKEYIILGDLITDLPFTNEIIDQIKELTPYVIKGNREQYLLNYEKTKEDKKWKSLQNKSVICYYDQLREDNKQYIRKLPEQLVLEFEGVKIRAVHGSVNNISELLYFNTPCMDKVFKELEEDILVYGHNHENADYQIKHNKIVEQVGTLGMHNNQIGKPQYTILDCKNGMVEVQMRTIEYNKERLKEEIQKAGGVYPEARIWQNLCYYNLVTGKDIRWTFCKMAEQEMILKYKENYPKGLDSHFVSFDDDVYLKVAKEYEQYFLL